MEQIFNPLDPVYQENRELRFIVSDIDILKFVDSKDRFTTTHDYYVPCRRDELPVKLKSSQMIIPSFLRTRVSNLECGLGCEIVFTHSPVYKEKLTEDQFKFKYPAHMNRVTACAPPDAYRISKVKLGNLVLPELDRTGCLEMIEISSKEFDGYRFLSGEFEYDNRYELKTFFTALKHHNSISLMCSYDEFICTYSSTTRHHVQ